MIGDGTGAGSDGALDRARSPEVLRQYLSIRGLSVTSPVLRGDTGGAFYDTDTQRLVSDARPDRKRSRRVGVRSIHLSGRAGEKEDDACRRHHQRLCGTIIRVCR